MKMQAEKWNKVILNWTLFVWRYMRPAHTKVRDLLLAMQQIFFKKLNDSRNLKTFESSSCYSEAPVNNLQFIHRNALVFLRPVQILFKVEKLYFWL